MHLNDIHQISEVDWEIKAANQGSLEVRKVFALWGRGSIPAQVTSIDVLLGFESDLHSLGGSIIRVLQ
jgi:hypothetical protein